MDAVMSAEDTKSVRAMMGAKTPSWESGVPLKLYMIEDTRLMYITILVACASAMIAIFVFFTPLIILFVVNILPKL